MKCVRCGAVLPDSAKFCMECGAPVPARHAPPVNTQHAHQANTQTVHPVSIQHAPPVDTHTLPRGGGSPVVRAVVNIVLVIALAGLQFLLLSLFSDMPDNGVSEEGAAMAQAVGFLPVLVLIVYIYRMDSIEKEPVSLLLRLFFIEGFVAMTAVVLAEVFMTDFFEGILDMREPLEVLFYYVVCIALMEELGKYLVLKKLTWRHRAFNYRFDGVVYAAMTALGFAAFENFSYVAEDGLATALTRSVTAVPGHCVDGVLMGTFYGLAKCADARGEKAKSLWYRFLSVAAPVAEHGFYDFAAGTEDETLGLLFVLYVFALNGAMFVAVWRLSQKDESVTGR